MNDPGHAEIALTEVIFAALAGTAFVWIWLVRRWRAGLPLVPYQGRRRVPWRGLDVLVVVVFFFLAADLFRGIAAIAFGPGVMQPVPQDGGQVAPSIRCCK